MHTTRIALRDEVIQTRKKFERWLTTLPENILQQPSRDPNWTNGEILYRISVSPLFIEWTLKENRENWQIIVDPKPMTGFSILKTHESFIRWHARYVTLWDLAREYEDNCNRILSILNRIADADLGKVLIITDNNLALLGYITVGQFFHLVKNYFDTYRKLIEVGR